MKAIVVFMCVLGLMSSFAETDAQSSKLNFQIEKGTVKDVLEMIEHQSGLSFMYDNDVLDVSKEVSLKVKNETIEDVLKLLLADENLKYEKVNRYIIISADNSKSVQQERSVSGKVTDSFNQPLPGVAIVVKSTGKGTVTDVDGNYSIADLPADATLVFSFVGMTTKEIEVGNQRIINTTLEQISFDVNEVVVVAYGSQSRSTLTGSLQSVNSDEITMFSAPDVAHMLQSVATGLQVTSASGAPGDKPELRIRGEGSLNYTNEPLWVVDGVIYGSQSPDINPNDIETLSILKDAAAASLYGARASNGVILVKTKQGKANSQVFSFTSNTGVSRLNMGHFSLMNSRELYDYMAPVVGNGFDILYQQLWDEAAMKWPGYELVHIRNTLGTTDKNEYLGKHLPTASSANVLNGTDWIDIATQTGIVHDYNLSYRGGTDRTTVFASLGYYNEKGAIIGHKWEKFSGRVNLDFQASKKVKLIAKLGGVYQSKFNNENEAFRHAQLYLPWDNPYFDNGDIKLGRTEKDGQVWYGRDQNNFLFPRQFNYTTNRRMEYITDLGTEIKFTNWLRFTSNNRLLMVNTRFEEIVDTRSPLGQADDGTLKNNYTYNMNITTSNLFHFDHKVDKHQIFGIVGYEFSKASYDNLFGEGKGIYPTLKIMDAASEPKNVGGGRGKYAFLSLLSNVQYIYDNKYMVQASFRRDGSSRFGANKRYGNFFSLGTSWAIHEENFMKGQNVFNSLKLRASYGSVGNANISDFVAMGLYNMTLQYNGIPGGNPSRLPNENLTWESNYNANIAIDALLFNRINFTVDLYSKKTENLLMEVPMPNVTGFRYITDNIGSIRNNGVEFLIGADVVKTKNFGWNITGNISFNSNEILELNNGEDINIEPKIWREGGDKNTWYMRKWAGVDPENGDPLWEKVVENEDGSKTTEITNVYTEATLQEVGTSSPKFFGGLTNRLSYKGFSLIANFNFVSGNKIYHSARKSFDHDGTYIGYNSMNLYDGWNRWEKPGDKATHPKPFLMGNHFSNQPSSRYLEDGSYLRLRNLTLAYSIPSNVVKKLGLSSVKVKLSGDNIWTLTNFSGKDPEVGGYGEANEYQFPVTRKYMFGLNVEL